MPRSPGDPVRAARDQGAAWSNCRTARPTRHTRVRGAVRAGPPQPGGHHRRHQLAGRTRHPTIGGHTQGLRRQPHPARADTQQNPGRRRAHRPPTPSRPARPHHHDAARPRTRRPRKPSPCRRPPDGRRRGATHPIRAARGRRPRTDTRGRQRPPRNASRSSINAQVPSGSTRAFSIGCCVQDTKAPSRRDRMYSMTFSISVDSPTSALSLASRNRSRTASRRATPPAGTLPP